MRDTPTLSPHELFSAAAIDEISTSRIMRHGFVWWLATFTSVGGIYFGYCLALVGGLVYGKWTSFQRAFPNLSSYETNMIATVTFSPSAQRRVVWTAHSSCLKGINLNRDAISCSLDVGGVTGVAARHYLPRRRLPW
eukprot:6206546-Pleurochrysis_carterae.AAC.10